MSSMPFPAKLILPLVLRLAGTRPPESAIRKGLAAGLDETVVARVIADFSPEPRAYFTSRTTTDDRTLHAVRTRRFLVTTDDAELPVTLQRVAAQRLGATVSEVASGHLPMLSHPEVVAAAVRELVEA